MLYIYIFSYERTRTWAETRERRHGQASVQLTLTTLLASS